MRIVTRRTAVPTPPEAYIKLRASLERDDKDDPVFLIEIRNEKTGQWEQVRLVDGERIDFTVYLP